MKARRKTRERERERKKGRFSQHVSHWRLSVPPLIRDSTKDVRARERERACALALPSIAPPLLRFSYAV